MADVIRFMDGFDHYVCWNQATRKGYGGNFFDIQTGRYGGSAMMLATLVDITKSLSVSSQAWRVGFAVKMVSHSQATQRVFFLRDSGTEQVDLGWNFDRQLRVTRNGTLLGQANRSLVLGNWHYIEWYVVISDSITEGQCQVRLDDEVVINCPTGTDTKNGSSSSANSFAWVGYGSNNWHFDDFVISSMDVTTTPTFLGDVKITTLMPNADGNYSQFVGNDGNSTNNYQLVDEATSNDDTDYVESDVVGNKDSYNLPNLSVTPEDILAVQVVGTVKKGDAGARTGKTFIRISGTDYESSSFSPGTSYAHYMQLMETSPATSSAWTESEINGMEAGIKVES